MLKFISFVLLLSLISCDGQNFVFEPSGDFNVIPDQTVTLTTTYGQLSTVPSKSVEISAAEYFSYAGDTPEDRRSGLRFEWNELAQELYITEFDLATGVVPATPGVTVSLATDQQTRDVLIIDYSNTQMLSSGCNLDNSQELHAILNAKSEVISLHVVISSEFRTTDTTLVTCFDYLSDYRDQLLNMNIIGSDPSNDFLLSGAISIENLPFLSTLTVETSYSVTEIKSSSTQRSDRGIVTKDLFLNIANPLTTFLSLATSAQ